MMWSEKLSSRSGPVPKNVLHNIILQNRSDLCLLYRTSNRFLWQSGFLRNPLWGGEFLKRLFLLYGSSGCLFCIGKRADANDKKNQNITPMTIGVITFAA